MPSDRRKRPHGRRDYDGPGALLKGLGRIGSSFSPLSYDIVRKRFLYNSVPLDITQRECQVLIVLLSEPGKVVSSRDIAIALWPDAPLDYIDVKKNSVKQVIYTLRKKIAAQTSLTCCINTVRGFGYRFDTEATATSPAMPGPAP